MLRLVIPEWGSILRLGWAESKSGMMVSSWDQPFIRCRSGSVCDSPKSRSKVMVRALLGAGVEV